jgi:hypothetical protein
MDESFSAFRDRLHNAILDGASIGLFRVALMFDQCRAVLSRGTSRNHFIYVESMVRLPVLHVTWRNAIPPRMIDGSNLRNAPPARKSLFMINKTALAMAIRDPQEPVRRFS